MTVLLFVLFSLICKYHANYISPAYLLEEAELTCPPAEKQEYDRGKSSTSGGKDGEIYPRISPVDTINL
jgi:hypothetical protein